MQELNIELMDTLLAAIMGLLDYCRKHSIHCNGLDGIASLVGRAGRICEEIGAPYDRTHIIESILKDNADKPPDKLPVYLGGGVCHLPARCE